MMELTKQGYLDIMLMPLGRFYAFLNWKIKLEEEKSRQMEDKIKDGNIRGKRK